MTGSDLFREIGNISEEYVVEAENYRDTYAFGFRILRSPAFRKALTTAACLAVCLGLVVTVQRLGIGTDLAKESIKEENTAKVEMAVQEAAEEAAEEATEEAAEETAEEMESSTAFSVAPEIEESKKIGASEVTEYSKKNEEAVMDKISEWDSKAAQKRLAEYPDDYESLLAEENALIIAHGNVKAGQSVWENFLMRVDAGEPTQIDIIRFTVEGDAIIEEVYYDGECFRLLVDNSRDAYRGLGDAYYEASYKYLQKVETSLEDGGKTVEYMLTENESDESEYYSIAYIVK